MTNVGPVGSHERIEAVDAARGLALLGIFLVNIALFAQPFGTFLEPQIKGTAPEQAVKYFVAIFCTGKFYGLFSLLFGIGFVLQRRRVLARGEAWASIYLRRLLFLAFVGLLHVSLLWYGDILFIYATAAVVLLACGRLPARTLAITAAVVLFLSGLVASMMASAQYASGATRQSVAAAPAGASGESPDAATAREGEAVVPPAGPERGEMTAREAEFWGSPFGRLINGFKTGQIQSPASELWQSAEREAYSRGPYTQIIAFRYFTWAMMLAYCALGFWWTVVAMFFLGAALAKSDAFAPGQMDRHRLFVKLGFFVGVPLVGAAVVTISKWPNVATMGIAMLVGALASPLVSLGYLSAVTLFVQSGRAGGLVSALAATGRMAFTNYLVQSLLATTIFYFYGLGLFARTGAVEQVGIALAIYLMQVGLSVVWMRRFEMGPLEWLWRRFTYKGPWRPAAG